MRAAPAISTYRATTHPLDTMDGMGMRAGTSDPLALYRRMMASTPPVINGTSNATCPAIKFRLNHTDGAVVVDIGRNGISTEHTSSNTTQIASSASVGTDAALSSEVEAECEPAPILERIGTGDGDGDGCDWAGDLFLDCFVAPPSDDDEEESAGNENEFATSAHINSGNPTLRATINPIHTNTQTFFI